MKKLLFLIIISMAIFAGCTKDITTPQIPLSEFILDNTEPNILPADWECTYMDNTSYQLNTLGFNPNGSYRLYLSVPATSLIYNGTYTIDDNLNLLTITNVWHKYSDNVNELEFITYTVTWNINQMIWVNIKNPDDILKFNR